MVATDEKRQADVPSGFALRVAPEDQAAYDRLIRDAVEWYQPESPAMHDLVLRIVNANWLLQSLQNYASAAMCKGMAEGTRLANGFSDVALFEAIARNEGTLNRTLDNARRNLQELREEIREEKITKRTRNELTQGAPDAAPAHSKPLSSAREIGEKERRTSFESHFETLPAEEKNYETNSLAHGPSSQKPPSPDSPRFSFDPISIPPTAGVPETLSLGRGQQTREPFAKRTKRRLRAQPPHRQPETRTKPELKKRTNKLVGPAPPTAGSPI
jgi:hypothetical protein